MILGSSVPFGRKIWICCRASVAFISFSEAKWRVRFGSSRPSGEKEGETRSQWSEGTPAGGVVVRRSRISPRRASDLMCLSEAMQVTIPGHCAR